MVTEQQTSTPMQDWVAQALERMKPILDGTEQYGLLTNKDINVASRLGDYFEVEKDAMLDILERVEWLAQHFKVLPEPCYADHSEIFRAGGVAALNSVMASMSVMHPLEEGEEG